MSGKSNRDYITHQGQICYDQILPENLKHARITWAKPPGGPGVLMAAAVTAKVWHKKTLNVCFMERGDEEEQILSWAKIWSEYCGVQFQRVDTPQDSDIRIGYTKQGAWSFIGTDCMQIPRGDFTMNLGFIDKATVLHEFGHALGLIHEHQSPAEGGFEWNKELVTKALQGPPNYWDKSTIDINMFNQYDASKITATKYDTTSIMHYSFPGDWIKGSKYPKGIPRNTELSPNDKKLICQFYGPPIGKPSAGLQSARALAQNAKKKSSSSMLSSIPTPCMDEQLPNDIKAVGLPVFEPNKGKLTNKDELMVKFHTLSRQTRYRIVATVNNSSYLLMTLLGPADPQKYITRNTNTGTVKIADTLFPNQDYYVKVEDITCNTQEFRQGDITLSITADT